jgi:hypothetical protein
MKHALLTAALSLLVTALSCGYNAIDARISALEKVPPDIAALQANQTNTSRVIDRLEKKIDWIMEHMALRKDQ